jgi:hypothetical protein
MGGHLLAAFDAAVMIVADAPNRWPLAPHVSPALGVRRYLFKHFPYGLLYRLIADDHLEVVAFARQKRKPGYWIERPRKPPR